MKIGIYTPYLESIGGGEKYAMAIAETLSKKEEVDVEEDIELKDLEKQIMELGRVFEEGEELKPRKAGFLHKIGLFKKGILGIKPLKYK